LFILLKHGQRRVHFSGPSLGLDMEKRHLGTAWILHMWSAALAMEAWTDREPPDIILCDDFKTSIYCELRSEWGVQIIASTIVGTRTSGAFSGEDSERRVRTYHPAEVACY
jgi:hypothetical protein